VNFDLNTIWFLLVGVLLTGYALLDGFDLGVGALHLLVKKDEHRRLLLNAIGPVWDGNEVWLVTGGGALFAAFPEAYATVFSGFYAAFFLFLAMLIFRAVSIDFRSKLAAAWWRSLWDAGFALGSVGAGFLIGVAMGNIAWGVPLDEHGELAISFFDLLHPYALWMGVTTVALFMMHGAIYLHLKTEGELQEMIRGWIRPCIIFFVLSYVVLSMATLLYVPHLTEHVRNNPWLFPLVILSILAIANIPREAFHERPGRAFLSSCAALILLMALFGLNAYPDLVHSRPHPEHSLTAYNAASSQKTLAIMLVIAGIGMPVVVGYTAAIYWIFRGKVKLSDTSY
jgi:cytochrome d ubiquinol oxidase subunit II